MLASSVPSGCRSTGTASTQPSATRTEPSATVALGCVDAVPVLLQPEGTDDASIERAVADAALDPPSDVHGSADYRRHLAAVCAVRAVRQATTRRG